MNAVRSSVSCSHLDNYKKIHGFETYSPYSAIHTTFVTCIARGSREKKAKFGKCQECHTRRDRLHGCLHCMYFGCFINGHMVKHSQVTGHIISMDIKFGNLFCHVCNNYMYDEEFEAMSKKWKEMAEKMRGDKIPYELTPKKFQLAEESLKTVHENSPFGIRGLVNLGNTCYVNCIVQVLITTGLLRDYFLNDTHRCEMEEPQFCIVCEMSLIFQEFYSGNRGPLVLARLMYLMCIHTEHLNGPQQQDAHEFFLLLLDIMHKQCQGIELNETNKCNCIIDQIFKGFYQSDIVCKECSHTSTTYDPFVDISLNLGGSTTEGEEGAKPGVSLLDCISRHTQPEDLQIKCTTCDSTSSTKQLALKHLPAVICFHINRLEHSSMQKNTSHVIFHECIDMSPYMSSNLCPNTPNVNEVDASDNKMYLFGVVCHKGDRDGGHYISYIRQHKRWYKCDDVWITPVTLLDVLACEGYLLFYQKQVTVSEGNSTGRRKLPFFGPG